MKEFLDGKKSYLAAVLAGVLAVGLSLGYIDESQAKAVEAAALALGIAGLRAAISKL